MKKILIVEDDLKLNNGIRLALKGQEYICYQSDSASSARETLQKEKVDLILLDINLPDGSGLDWLVDIRKMRLSKDWKTKQIMEQIEVVK